MSWCGLPFDKFDAFTAGKLKADGQMEMRVWGFDMYPELLADTENSAVKGENSLKIT
jgi:hypothetical protein